MLLLELLEAEVLTLDATFQVRERLAELLKNVRRSVAVASGVILGVDWVYYYEHLLTLRRLLVERPRKHHTVQLVSSKLFLKCKPPFSFSAIHLNSVTYISSSVLMPYSLASKQFE